MKSRPTGKVLQGYWENWDGASNGVHPGLGWIPITDSRLNQHGYNVINAAFPVIRSDGTVLWENGMDAGVKVATPAEMCQAKAAGATILMSIGGAAAGIDLSSTAVADRFIATIVPILTAYHFDGIDIDIETGLTGSGNINTLSTSQANLIRIIDGVLARMPSNFGLTMAPETAYVTGGSVVYGSIWGSYLPIIKKYVDNGRLWWLNMQYYNGSMYGCSRRLVPGGHRAGLHRADAVPQQRPHHPGHHHPRPVRQAGPGPARTDRGRRWPHVDVAGHAGLELRARPQGPDDLVGELGRVEGVDVRRQREAPAGPLTGEGTIAGSGTRRGGIQPSRSLHSPQCRHRPQTSACAIPIEWRRL